MDEGLYLNGARRILHGQVLYKDFFAFTGPIVYWAASLIEWIVGLEIAVIRSITAFAIGAIAVGVFSLAASLGGRPAATAGALIWFGLTIDLWHRLELHHRWLSSAWMSLAAVVLFHTPMIGTRAAFAAGVFLSLAAWTTQSYLFSILLLLAYFAWRNRPLLRALLAGLIFSGSIPLLILLFQGAMGPLIQNLAWAASNYAAANKFAFGYTMGEVPLRYAPHIYSVLLLIPASLFALLVLRLSRRDTALELPFAFGAAILVSSYPKWDASQLLYIGAPFVAISSGLMFRYLPAKLEPLTTACVCMPAAFLVLNALFLPGTLTPHSSRAGMLAGTPADVAALAQIESAIPARATLFVYPYLTALYPLLNAENPSRYEYLQPGMMTDADETNVLADFALHSPDYIYWHALPDSEVLRIWPNTDPKRLHFSRIESWIRANYEAGVEISGSPFLGQVWRLRPRN